MSCKFSNTFYNYWLCLLLNNNKNNHFQINVLTIYQPNNKITLNWHFTAAWNFFALFRFICSSLAHRHSWVALPSASTHQTTSTKNLIKKTYIHPRCANLARLWIWRWTSCIHMSALRPSVDRKTLVIHRWEFVVARLWLRGCPIFWLWPTFIMVHWPASHVRGLKIYIEWSFYMDNRHWENGKGTKRYHKSFRRWFVWGNTIDTESVLPPHLDNELFGNVLPGGARMRMTL